MELEYDDIYEDDLEILHLMEHGFPRKIHVRKNHFDEMDNLSFFRRFSLYKESCLHLLTLIEHELEVPNNINNSVSPINQLLTCLRFYASAGHLSALADFAGMDIATVSRIVVRVSEAIARLAPMYIKMPTAENIIREKTKFYNVARFPKIIGLVDGTHIRIQSPGGDDAEIFRNRKSYFSINTQVTCNADLKFIDVVARWPGSTHDATVYNNSRLRARFEGGYIPNSFLLGDSGYPLRTYFLTPLANPVTRAQRLYNESHIRTRNLVERIIGIWKRRFPVLAYGMRLKLDTVLTVIIATAVLHNLAREMNEPEPPYAEGLNEAELNYLIEMGQMPNIPVNVNMAEDVRSDLILNYFSTI